MNDYKTSKGARILFVGINPHPGSDRRGVPFSNNKMFWYLLNRAGLLREAESDKNDQSLKAIYDKKFSPHYSLNFVNLVDRPTIDVTELEKGEEQAGVRRLLKVIRTCKPKVVCFHRQDRLEHLSRQPNLRLGLADGHCGNKGLSHALSHQRAGVSSCE